MKRRAFLAGVGATLVAFSSKAQHSGKIPRVGLLSPGTSKEAPSVQREPFETGLRELGWMPGSKVQIDYRYAEGSPTRLSELAGDLVRSGVDIIVARAPAAIHAARNASATIPIVMSFSTDDPIAEGLVKNLSRPGGNVTGLVAPVFELDGKRLEILKEALPAIQRVAVLTNPNFDAKQYPKRNKALQSSARAVKVDIQFVEVTRPDEFPSAFASMARSGIDGLLVRADRYILDSHGRDIASMAAHYRLPAMHPWRFFVEFGGLMCYGPSLSALHHRSASYVNRILRGANPGDLALEQPSKFELIINLSAAKALGIEIPKAILFRADGIIE
jgi:putative ABC transport system substrate-binding protein